MPALCPSLPAKARKVDEDISFMETDAGKDYVRSLKSAMLTAKVKFENLDCDL